MNLPDSEFRSVLPDNDPVKPVPDQKWVTPRGWKPPSCSYLHDRPKPLLQTHTM